MCLMVDSAAATTNEKLLTSGGPDRVRHPGWAMVTVKADRFRACRAILTASSGEEPGRTGERPIARCGRDRPRGGLGGPECRPHTAQRPSRGRGGVWSQTPISKHGQK